MRFPLDALVLTVLIAGAGGASTPAAEFRPDPGTAVTPEEVRAAAERLRSDPDLGGERKVRSLRWSRASAPEPPQEPPRWIQGLFEYLGQTGSVLLWVGGSIMAAIAVLWAYRTLKARLPARAIIAAPVVARVGGMDIRPESLPGDNGQAALALAERGKTREAISLLYRGALSRAVHRFGVPIGESYTEGEALIAVGGLLDPSRVAYFSDLVGMRRRAVYAGESMAAGSVGHLCRRFSAALDAPR